MFFNFFCKFFNNKIIVISKTILKCYRNFFWCFITQIANIMCSSSIFTSKMIMLFFLSSALNYFLHMWQTFWSRYNFSLFVDGLISFLFSWFIIFMTCSLKSLQNFHAAFTSIIIKPIFCCIKWTMCRQLTTRKYMFTCFSCWWLFRIIVKSIYFFK